MDNLDVLMYRDGELEREEVEGHLVGENFGAHQPAWGGGAWALTHLPTGRVAAQNLRRLRDAKALVARLEEQHDWAVGEWGGELGVEYAEHLTVLQKAEKRCCWTSQGLEWPDEAEEEAT